MEISLTHETIEVVAARPAVAAAAVVPATTSQSPTAKNPRLPTNEPQHRQTYGSVAAALAEGEHEAVTILLPACFAVFDQGHLGNLDFKQFVDNVALLCTGSVSEQLRFCFNVYDWERVQKLDVRGVQRYDLPALSQVLSQDLAPLLDALVRQHIENEKMFLTFSEFIFVVDQIPRLAQLLDVAQLLEPPQAAGTVTSPPPPLVSPRLRRLKSNVPDAALQLRGVR